MSVFLAGFADLDGEAANYLESNGNACLKGRTFGAAYLEDHVIVVTSAYSNALVRLTGDGVKLIDSMLVVFLGLDDQAGQIRVAGDRFAVV